MPPLRRWGALRTEPPLRMSAMPSTFSSTEAEYVRLALWTMFAGERGADSVRLSLQTAHRFPLAGECPLCGAERLEDGAPAPRDRLRRKV